MLKQVIRPNFEKRQVEVGKNGERKGLVTVVVQEYLTKEILMVAYTDEAGYRETLSTAKAVYFSTSRNERWKKGETSGDGQEVMRILVDCDGDALVYQVSQQGVGACHTRARSCFYRSAVGGLFLMAAPKAPIV